MRAHFGRVGFTMNRAAVPIGQGSCSAGITYFREDFLPRIARISRMGMPPFPIREIRGSIYSVAACRAVGLCSKFILPPGAIRNSLCVG